MTHESPARDAEFLRDLAGRLFRNATPAMGFDQGDTDQLHRIASALTTPSPSSEYARGYAAGVSASKKVVDGYYPEWGACAADTLPFIAMKIEDLTPAQPQEGMVPDGWKPIDSAPKDGSVLLATDGLRVEAVTWCPAVKGDGFPWVIFEGIGRSVHMPAGCCDHEDAERIEVNGWMEKAPTHWMPLPAAPKEAK